MKNILISIFLLVSTLSFGQKFYAYGNLSSRTVGAGLSRNVTITLFNGGYKPYPDANYATTDITTGMVVWINCTRFPITAIVSTSPLVLTVADSMGTGGLDGLDLYGYRLAILEESRVSSYNIAAFQDIADGNAGTAAGLSPKDGACIQNYYGSQLDLAITNSNVSTGDKNEIDVVSATDWRVDTAAITLVKMASNSVDSAKIVSGGIGITDASAALVNYIRQPGVDSISAHRTDITNLQTLTGRPDGSTNLGTMGQGTQYPDNLSVKTFADSTDAKLGRVQPSISTLPAGYAITSAEKIASADSTYTFQKQVNQLRDSTLIGVATVEAIMNLPSTTPEFSRILVKNTGATFLVVDSVDIKVSDTVDDFASTSPASASVWVYKSDTTAVVKILGTTKYAIFDPINGVVPVSKFIKSSLNDSESLQKAIDYSFWTTNMYRNSITNVVAAISPVMSSVVLIDRDLELVDSIYIRYGITIRGLALAGLDRYYEPVIKFNLNDATKNGTFLDQFGAAATGKSGSLENLRIEATSPMNAIVNLNYPNDFVVNNVKLDGGSSRFAKYGLKTFGFVHEEIHDLSIKDVSDAAVYLSSESTYVGTTITFNDLKIIECKYGVFSDSASTYDLYIKRPSFETVDSSILSLARGVRAYISEIYTEGCTAFNIIEVGTGTTGGSALGKYFISNSKIETNLSVTSGSIINSKFTELLDISNVEMAGKLTSITTTSSTSLLNLRNVTMGDITTNTAAFDRGALTGVNPTTNVNTDEVLVSSLGYTIGLINSKKFRTALIDDGASSLRGIYNIQYSATAGTGAREITRRYSGTQLVPLAVPVGANISTKDWEAYVGSVTGNIIAARIAVTGNGGAVTDAAGGFPSDMYIGLCNGTVGAASNNVLQIRGTTGSLGIGTYPDRKLHSEVSSAVTNTVEYAERLSHITSGTAAANFGVGLEYELENASGTNRVVATQEAVYSTATNAIEAGSLITKVIKAGTLDTAIVVKSTGQIQEMEYGGHAFTGTPTNFAAWDVNGNRIERSAAELLTDIGAIGTGSGWQLGGQNITAENSIGSNDAFGVNIETNNVNRLRFNSAGRMFGGTLTDVILDPSDSFNLIVGANGLIGSTAFTRLVANGIIALQANHSTGATAMVVPDNTVSAYQMSISGGATVLSATSTDGAESVAVGSTATGASVTLNGGLIQAGVVTITASGTTAINGEHTYLRIDATTGAQTYTLPTATLGRVLEFKRIDNNAATVITFTGTVDGTVNPTSTGGGSPIAALATQYGSIKLIGNGTNFDQL